MTRNDLPFYFWPQFLYQREKIKSIFLESSSRRSNWINQPRNQHFFEILCKRHWMSTIITTPMIAEHLPNIAGEKWWGRWGMIWFWLILDQRSQTPQIDHYLVCIKLVESGSGSPECFTAPFRLRRFSNSRWKLEKERMLWDGDAIAVVVVVVRVIRNPLIWNESRAKSCSCQLTELLKALNLWSEGLGVSEMWWGGMY